MTDYPCATVTGSGFESDKLEVCVDVAAAVRMVPEDDKLVEVRESWLDSAGMAWR